MKLNLSKIVLVAVAGVLAAPSVSQARCPYAAKAVGPAAPVVYGAAPVVAPVPVAAPVPAPIIVHVYEDDATTAKVQIALRDKGFYKGGVDGTPGRSTRAAIFAYQVEKKLIASGRIDKPLLKSLGV